jgi:hypothetical protein
MVTGSSTHAEGESLTMERLFRRASQAARDEGNCPHAVHTEGARGQTFVKAA